MSAASDNKEQEVWRILYTNGRNGRLAEYMHSLQSFKSEHCARRGVNVLASGYVLGFTNMTKGEDTPLERPIKCGSYYQETGLIKEFE